MKRALKTTTFLLTEPLAGNTVWHDVKSWFPVAGDKRFTFHRAYYDTFDWRLYRGGCALSREGRRFELRDLDDDSVMATAEVAVECKFWWDFPAGALRSALRDRLETRALLLLVNVKIDRRVTNVLNKGEKTIARLYADDVVLSNGSSTPEHVRTVTLRSVGGHREKARAVAHRMIDQGLTPETRSWLDLVLEHGGKTPCDYSPKLELRLTSDMSAREATVAIFTELLRTIDRNEHGICSDIDAEFLHDFRVAVRRTRAGLAQIKDVFPPDVTERFKDDFSRLGKLTNRLRDVDVYLLRKREYQAMLPASFRPALQPMFEELSKERAAELERVVGVIRSDEYRQRLSLWREFLGDSHGVEGANATVPIGGLARRWIRRRHRRVIRMGNIVDASSPDKDLHSLRIELKKLRYVLEFFASLYRPKRVRRIIQQLKQLQDNLGACNDLAVEQAELERQFGRIDSSTETADAIRRLIQTLGPRRQDAKKAFSSSFKKLRSKNSVRMYNELFDH